MLCHDVVLSAAARDAMPRSCSSCHDAGGSVAKWLDPARSGRICREVVPPALPDFDFAAAPGALAGMARLRGRGRRSGAHRLGLWLATSNPICRRALRSGAEPFEAPLFRAATKFFDLSRSCLPCGERCQVRVPGCLGNEMRVPARCPSAAWQPAALTLCSREWVFPGERSATNGFLDAPRRNSAVSPWIGLRMWTTRPICMWSRQLGEKGYG